MMKAGFSIHPHHVVEENKSSLTSVSFEVSGSSSNRNDSSGMYPPEYFSSLNQPQPQTVKKKRNQPCHPDPDAEVIAYSPRTLLSTNRFVCEICNKGFQRDQNLQLHRRGHNLPWKLKKRTDKEAIRKKVYVCPETSCAHHDPSRALGDLTGIKKHFFRKHGEKKWKCDKCAKRYAVQSDWKAHSKICGTREYKCECGNLFSRKDSFISHRGFCDVATEEKQTPITFNNSTSLHQPPTTNSLTTLNFQQTQISQFNNNSHTFPLIPIKREQQNYSLNPEMIPPWIAYTPLIGPGTPLHQSTQSYLLQDSHQNYDQYHDDDQNLNPNPSCTLPFYYPPPPPSPRPHQITHVYNNGVMTGGGGSTESGASAGDTSIINFPSLFNHDDDHMMMMMNGQDDPLSNSSTTTGIFEGSNILFGGIMNQYPSSQNLGATPACEFSTTSTTIDQGEDNHEDGEINDEMTRDFLGLRSLFQSDYNPEYNWFKGLFEQKCL